MKFLKNFSLVLALFLLLTLCIGCGNSNNNTTPPNDDDTPSDVVTPDDGGETPDDGGETEQIDLSNVLFKDVTTEYDGQVHTIEPENVPEGIVVAYENNSKINAGEYTVKLIMSKDDVELKTLTAKLTITKRSASVTIDNQKSSVDDLQELTYTVEGVIGEDDLGVELFVDSSSSGIKEIKGAWNNENYDVTFNVATYTFTDDLFNSSSLTATSPFLPNFAPFSLYDNTCFSNSVITSISFPFHSFASGYNKNSYNLFVPIYVVKNDFSTRQSECTVANGKLVILDLTGKLNNIKQGDWVTCDNLNIVVGENETLAFGDPTMTVLPGFLRDNGTYGFWNRIFDNKGQNNHSLIFEIEGYKTKESTNTNNGFVEDNIDYISFLGDSISTYSGISNSTSYNSTIGSNAIWYPNNNYGGANLAASDTWWHQTASQLGYQICVNNSWSGSVINSSQTYNVRAKNLHNNSKHAPDVIVIFMGVNDYAAKTTVGTYNGTTTAPINPTNFSEAYGRVLTNIKETYPDAEIFCCTFLSDRKRMSSDVNGAGISINDYLNAIKTIATNLGANVIDLYNDSGINGSNISTYTVDRLHPNAIGMDLITNTVVEAITEVLKAN